MVNVNYIYIYNLFFQAHLFMLNYSQFLVHIKVYALFTKCWQIVFKVGGEKFHNYGNPLGDDKEEKIC